MHSLSWTDRLSTEWKAVVHAQNFYQYLHTVTDEVALELEAY